VLFVQHPSKNSRPAASLGCLYIACAGSFGFSDTATEGATQRRPVLKWGAYIPGVNAGVGGGAKRLSSVPGAYVRGRGEHLLSTHGRCAAPGRPVFLDRARRGVPARGREVLDITFKKLGASQFGFA
jgi:hypothetical protein